MMVPIHCIVMTIECKLIKQLFECVPPLGIGLRWRTKFWNDDYKWRGNISKLLLPLKYFQSPVSVAFSDLYSSMCLRCLLHHLISLRDCRPQRHDRWPYYRITFIIITLYSIYVLDYCWVTHGALIIHATCCIFNDRDIRIHFPHTYSY